MNKLSSTLRMCLVVIPTAALALSGCSDEGYENNGMTGAGSHADGDTGVAILPGMDGTLREQHYTVVNGLAIREGDIVLGTLEELENMEKGLYRTNKKWTSRRVRYTITHSNATTQSRIQNAITAWTNQTGIRFEQSTSGNYIEFRDFANGGCNSPVGMQGNGRQYVTLQGTNCSLATITHEIGHALGMEHEQNRCGRGALITVRTSRVATANQFNFTEICDSATTATQGDMDFNSVMMYGSYAFATDNTKPPMVRANVQGCDGASPPAQCVWNGGTSIAANDRRSMCTLYNEFPSPTRDGFPVDFSSGGQVCKEAKGCGYVGMASGDAIRLGQGALYMSWNGTAWVRKTSDGNAGSLQSHKCKY